MRFATRPAVAVADRAHAEGAGEALASGPEVALRACPRIQSKRVAAVRISLLSDGVRSVDSLIWMKISPDFTMPRS